MIEIIHGYYYKYDGLQYMLIREFDRECVDIKTRQKTGEVRTVQEIAGYYTTLAAMLTAVTKYIAIEGIERGEIKTLAEHIEKLRKTKEELENLINPF